MSGVCAYAHIYICICTYIHMNVYVCCVCVNNSVHDSMFTVRNQSQRLQITTWSLHIAMTVTVLWVFLKRHTAISHGFRTHYNNTNLLHLHNSSVCSPAKLYHILQIGKPALRHRACKQGLGRWLAHLQGDLCSTCAPPRAVRASQ